MSDILDQRMPPALPPKDAPSSLRREAQRQNTGGPSEWRNSLVAIDDETGSVIGIFAKGVVLSKDEEVEEEHQTQPSSDEDEGDEAVTPNTQLEYVTAHIYNDADVRPPSRAASILREDTFAPPPIPTKPDYLRAVGIEDENATSSFVVKEDEGDVVDGQIGVSAPHAEAHRPDLLRDANRDAEEECDSDASGSTVGGPAVQIWRKARGGKKAEAKRKAKRKAKKVKENSKVSKQLPLPTMEEPHASEDEEQDLLPTSQILSDPLNSIELKTRGPGYWLHATKKSVMSRHLPGNSVLIEFLAGSRIGASVIRSARPYIPKQRATDSLKGPTVFTPTSVASIPQNGMMAYIPVLPSHLLWYFGMDSTTPEDASKAGQDDKGLAVMGEDLLAFAKAVSPSAIAGLAYSSADAAWSSMLDWTVTATNWFDAGLSMLPWAGLPDSKPNLEEAEAGDDDAEECEWEWAIPEFDASTFENTPRPIYRRKKLNPSLQGHYTTNRSSSYSIVHCDDQGIIRRAITRNRQDMAI